MCPFRHAASHSLTQLTATQSSSVSVLPCNATLTHPSVNGHAVMRRYFCKKCNTTYHGGPPSQPRYPPYITDPPFVINITIGRQLFVDTFLIDSMLGVQLSSHAARQSKIRFQNGLQATSGFEMRFALGSQHLWSWVPTVRTKARLELESRFYTKEGDLLSDPSTDTCQGKNTIQILPQNWI